MNLKNLQQFSKIVRAIISQPRSFLGNLYTWHDQVEKKAYLKKTYSTLQLPTVDWINLVGQGDVSVNNYSFLSGTSLITDIALLKLLAKKYDKCTYLEIGSFRGESISNVAEVAGECYSITLSDEEMREKKYSDEFIKVHGVFSKPFDKIISIGHDSASFDFSKLNKKFDLIFVDGDHSYQAIKTDSLSAFKLLKNENSIIVWHDYGFDTENTRYTTLAGILDGVPKEEHKYLYHVSNTMCAIFCRKKLESKFINFPSYPNKSFSLSLAVKKL